MKFSFIPQYQLQHPSVETERPPANRPARSWMHGLPRPKEDGSSLVEFALVLPLMLVLITGMATFGIAINNYMVLTDGVAAGARALSLARGQTNPALAASDPCAYAVQVANNALPTLNTSKVSYTIVWTTTDSGGTVVSTKYTTNTCTAMSLNSGDSVQVQGSYPATLILYGWNPKSLNMVALTSELVQ